MTIEKKAEFLAKDTLLKAKSNARPKKRAIDPNHLGAAAIPLSLSLSANHDYELAPCLCKSAGMHNVHKGCPKQALTNGCTDEIKAAAQMPKTGHLGGACQFRSDKGWAAGRAREPGGADVLCQAPMAQGGWRNADGILVAGVQLALMHSRQRYTLLVRAALNQSRVTSCSARDAGGLRCSA
ncbi:hypothetical protein L7F22_050605 [Adiantum nelumboides]|nr:hypothetical protein [Adiantum nelumboides]